MSLEELLNRLVKEGKLKRQSTDIPYLNQLTKAIYKTAQEFWRKVRAYLRKRNAQLELFEEF
jgi:hypothetical protein